MTRYTVGQYCRFVRNTHDYKIYAFCLYIDGTPDELNDISEVEYTLHSSFPDPVRISNDKNHAFAIQSEAWGGFATYIRIFTKRRKVFSILGTIDRRVYWLVLKENDWPMGERLIQFTSGTEQLIYNTLFDPKWEWRKVSTVARRAGVDLEEARSVLSHLASIGAVRKSPHVQFIDKEELWGATCVVGLLPSPMQTHTVNAKSDPN